MDRSLLEVCCSWDQFSLGFTLEAVLIPLLHRGPIADSGGGDMFSVRARCKQFFVWKTEALGTGNARRITLKDGSLDLQASRKQLKYIVKGRGLFDPAVKNIAAFPERVSINSGLPSCSLQKGIIIGASESKCRGVGKTRGRGRSWEGQRAGMLHGANEAQFQSSGWLINRRVSPTESSNGQFHHIAGGWPRSLIIERGLSLPLGGLPPPGLVFNLSVVALAQGWVLGRALRPLYPRLLMRGVFIGLRFDGTG